MGVGCIRAGLPNVLAVEALVLHGTDQTFNDGDASVLSHGSQALVDVPGLVETPGLEIWGSELAALIGDDEALGLRFEMRNAELYGYRLWHCGQRPTYSCI